MSLRDIASEINGLYGRIDDLQKALVEAREQTQREWRRAQIAEERLALAGDKDEP